MCIIKYVYKFVLGSRDKSDQFQNLYKESRELREQGISLHHKKASPVHR